MDEKHLLQPDVLQKNLNREQIVFRRFDLLMERILDPSFTMKELYLIATGSYLLNFFDAYKTAFREAQLEDIVLTREGFEVLKSDRFGTEFISKSASK